MNAIKFNINGSDYVGAFATSNDRFAFVGSTVSKKVQAIIEKTLQVSCIEATIFGSDMIGIFARSNSNGLLLSNLTYKQELIAIKHKVPDMNVGIIQSDFNALGNNIVANDKLAIVNPRYGKRSLQQIRDILDVEIIKQSVGGFNTVGANCILTNKGFAINNNSQDKEKEFLDQHVNVKSIRTTANTGGLSIGIATVANSNGIVVGDSTTGYELARLTEALNIE